MCALVARAQPEHIHLPNMGQCEIRILMVHMTPKIESPCICLDAVPSNSLNLRLLSKIEMVVATPPHRADVKIKRKYVNILAWCLECQGSSKGTYSFRC